MKILIIEDEKDIVRLLQYNLEKAGYKTILKYDGESGLSAFRASAPDLVLLDLMLPKMDGVEVCKTIRLESRVPIIMLTAKKDEVDRVLGLEIGADDYVTKPFGVRELLARVKAVLRRAADAPKSTKKSGMRAGTLEVDFERYEVIVKNKPVNLSTKEFELLKCLLEFDGKAMTRDQLLEKVWGYEQSMEIDTRTVDQHIARLREKLGAEAGRVVTVKNIGYRIKLD